MPFFYCLIVILSNCCHRKMKSICFIIAPRSTRAIGAYLGWGFLYDDLNGSDICSFVN